MIKQLVLAGMRREPFPIPISMLFLLTYVLDFVCVSMLQLHDHFLLSFWGKSYDVKTKKIIF